MNAQLRTSKALLFPLLLVIYEIAAYLSNDMYLPALPTMMNDLGLTAIHAQLTLTVWLLGSATMSIFTGALSDRFGRRPVLLTGGVVYIFASVLCAMTHSLTVFMIARVLQGSMVATMLVPGYASIHETYDHKEAVRILAIMGSISVLAPAFGPLLGGFVLYFSDWRTIFWFIAIWAAVMIILLMRWMPETCPPDKRQPLHLMTLVSQYKRIITNKEFMLLMATLGFIFAGFLAWITCGSLLVIDSFHYSEISFGWIQAVIFLAYIFANYMVKQLLETMSVVRLIRIGISVASIGGFAALVAAELMPSSIYPFLLMTTVYSFGAGLAFAPLNRTIIESSDEPMGVRVSVFSVFLLLYAVLGSVLASLFFNGSLVSLAVILAAMAILAGVMKWLAMK